MREVLAQTETAAMLVSEILRLDALQEDMRTPRPRPARRGYVILAVAIGVICILGMTRLHWSLIGTLLILIIGVAVSAGLLSLSVLGINRENRR
jgi:energy-converting hydrogenase Eha subunit A